MDFDYSPHRSHGGTMHLLSPSHTQYGVDSFPSIKQLRRSLSRSPSKPSRFQLQTSRSPKQSAASPISPSSLSHAFTVDTSIPDAPPTHTRPRFTLRKSVPPKSVPRRISPNSPARRVLVDNKNSSNIPHVSLPFRGPTRAGQENARTMPAEPPKLMRFELDSEPIKFDLLKAHADRPSALASAMRDQLSPAKSSPLKRSDGVMNLDSPNMSSPRAKRRSLHGGMLGTDFSILDQGFGDHDVPRPRKNSADDAATSPSQRSPQRRGFSLRKSTLQQRAGGSSRHRGHLDGEVSGSPSSSSKARFRMSLDGSLPMRSMEPINFFPNQTQAQKSTTHGQKPHPLSKTLSPSSSSNSITNEATLEAAASLLTAREQVRPKASFTRSLPIGALRPRLDESDREHHGSGDSFETPETYKMARPLPAAFMSTGLISKRNRNVDLPSTAFGSSTNMPDTPSKKSFMPSVSTTPAPSRSYNLTTQPRHEFGSPTTPFGPHSNRGSPESFGKGVSIFGSRVAQGRLIRRASFLSIEGDDTPDSPSARIDTQSMTDDLPPTPTKPAHFAPRPASKGKGNSLRSSLLGRRSYLAPDTFVAPEAIPAASCEQMNGEFSPTAARRDHNEHKDTSREPRASSITQRTISDILPSFGRSRRTIHERSPSPLSYRSSEKGPEITIQIAAPDTAHDSFMEDPITPLEQDSFTPPDTSRLSIHNDSQSAFSASVHGLAPATPTGPRDNSFPFGASSSLAGSSLLANDVDTALTSRFSSVQVYGIGEFSIVYRVEKPISNSTFAFQARRSLGQVWAVKKSKKPYSGSKDRSRKMKEVQILKALAGYEHIVETVDTWEMKNHLYIQTEFCENGNLKDFLSQTGYKARLDDFRIWKILLELSLGVKSIHDAGYIHLDLKPANVFIDWEGVLKIGDFGLASTWPAPPHLDGEGDREYIAPEVLGGHFDKPADIFALGMMMLEIAGNIVLPDNGMSWQRLRSGDMSDLPSLTFSSESTLVRDESGDPVGMLDEMSDDTLCAPSAIMDDDDDDLGFCNPHVRRPNSTPRARDLVQPPEFMVNSDHLQSLERIVQRLITPRPADRPTVEEILASEGVQWTAYRRRAGATIYEGNWGPADDVLNHAQDVEMIDI